MWSLKEQKAVKFSVLAHQGQLRKGKSIAYVSHPLTVGIILARMGCSEELVIAGILHDVIEDTDYEKEDIEREFGKKVADLVSGVSEGNKKDSWTERKNKTLEKLKNSSEEVVKLKAADLLANMTDLCDDLKSEGGRAFTIFSVDSSKKIAGFQKLIQVIKMRLNQDPIIEKLEERLNQISNYE